MRKVNASLIPTQEGAFSAENLCESLTYANYKANRSYGMSHESLVRLGIGNNQFKNMYEAYIKSLA